MNRLHLHCAIEATPRLVYQALTHKGLVEKWTGAPVKMDLWVGGEFSLFGGGVHGINRLLSTGRIEQLWKVKAWAHFSEVTFFIEKQAKGALVSLQQDGIPPDEWDGITEGWAEYYFRPIKALLE